MPEATTAERDGALQILRDNFGLKEGGTIYTVVRSAAGQSAVISLHVIHDGRILQLPPRRVALLSGHAVAEAGGNVGNRVKGWGTDRGFELVYNLGRGMFPNGVASDYAGRKNSDGGYAFRQEWL